MSELVRNILRRRYTPATSSIISQTDVLKDSELQNADSTEAMVEDEYDDHYADRYRRMEEMRYQAYPRSPANNTMSMIESNTDLISECGKLEVNELKQKQSCATFKKYCFDKPNIKLPIDNYQETILNFLDAYDVIIIQGPTGCGKTTRVPQFILDDCRTKNKPCKIAVTQPRRIAAITVARRVCDERSWGLGSVCGYQVGLDKQTANDTLLSYVTTGVLLQKLIKQKSLQEFTHIIIDEVHERSQDMDFLLLVIRRFLNTNSNGIKIILMSATINPSQFSKYFKTYTQDEFSPAAVIHMDEKTFHNVQVFYTDHLTPIGTVSEFDQTYPKINRDTYELFVRLIAALDKLDPVDSTTNESVIGNVLVFLPGILEIEEAHDQLMQYSKLELRNRKTCEWHIIPLHSTLTIEDQRRVFQPPPEGMRKIILSTNIAESSVTVPDIFYVVDFCLTKTMVMDPKTQYQSLQLQWASHTHCNQRAGRVGRVADGRVYRLVPETFYHKLCEEVTPEILRAPLHQVVLSAKMLELNEPPKAILALAMNPPNLESIDKSVLFLKEIGGLALTCRGVKLAKDGDITFLGRVMASLPIDVHLSKFIVLGHMFSCLEDCIIMATGCSLSIFKTPFKDGMKPYINCLQWADNSTCDFIAYLNLYKVWQRHKQRNCNVKEQRDWCKKNYVSMKNLREWNILVKEIKDRLNHFKIMESDDPGRVVLTDSEIPTIIKVVICGAFYPNYFKFPKQEDGSKEREAVKLLNGLDPFSTVYLTGFPENQPGPLYKKHIKNYFKECSSNIKITFNNSSKVYVQFLNPNQSESITISGQDFLSGMPGRIKVEVYRAIHLRQLKIPCIFKVMEVNKARTFARKLGINVDSSAQITTLLPKSELDSSKLDQSYNNSLTPGPDMSFLSIVPVERVDASHFWAHYDDNDTAILLEDIESALNNNNDLMVVTAIDISKYYATRYILNDTFYRCKVVSYDATDKSTNKIQVLFIDYGTTCTINSNQLYHLPDDEVLTKPPLAFECRLTQVQPSIVYNPKGLWSQTVNKLFDDKVLNKTFHAKIYSVVDDVAYLELYPRQEKELVFSNSFNAYLIERGYGQHGEETYLSKENHQKRLTICENPNIVYNYFENDKIAEINNDIAPPDNCICKYTLELKGPFSPLETDIHSVVKGGSNKKIRIDANSVNCVSLDTNPEDLHERLLVAGTIHLSPNDNSLNLKHTTLMPNIVGFPMLMALLFCPLVEIKPSADGSRIASILCGLGAQENRKPLYASHDISIILDTELTTEDINQINELRYWMNMSIQFLETLYNEVNVPTTIEECQRELKYRLYDLLKKQRNSIKRDYISLASDWGQFLYDADLLQPGDSGIAEEIWPLHSGIALNKKDNVLKLKSHEVRLGNMAKGVESFTEITCLFCDITLTSVQDARIHLASRRHKSSSSTALDLYTDTS